MKNLFAIGRVWAEIINGLFHGRVVGHDHLISEFTKLVHCMVLACLSKQSSLLFERKVQIELESVRVKGGPEK